MQPENNDYSEDDTMSDSKGESFPPRIKLWSGPDGPTTTPQETPSVSYIRSDLVRVTTCELCRGEGKTNGRDCVACDGIGLLNQAGRN